MKEPNKFWIELNAKLEQRITPLPGLFPLMILTHYGLGWKYPTWLWATLIALFVFVICAKVGLGSIVQAISNKD